MPTPTGPLIHTCWRPPDFHLLTGEHPHPRSQPIIRSRGITDQHIIHSSVPGEGAYRIEVQRAKQTFDYATDPQPPNMSTWWAGCSLCAPMSCTVVGTQFDDNDHTSPSWSGDGRPIVMECTDGQWQSRPETVEIPMRPTKRGSTDAGALVADAASGATWRVKRALPWKAMSVATDRR